MRGKLFNIYEQTFVIRSIFFFAFWIPFMNGGSVCKVLANEHSYDLGTLRISSLYIRGTIQSRPAAGYMTIHNLGSKSDKLITVSSPMANRVKFHKTIFENNVAKMLQIPHIPLPPKSTIILKPGGIHLMVMGLKMPLAADSFFPMTLKFEVGGTINTKSRIKSFSVKKMKHGNH